MDTIDRRLLDLLQHDAAQTIAELAGKVNLSSTACWKRVQRLEESGVIRKRVALLDATRLGVGVTVFVSIRTNQHNAQWLARFHAAVSAIPEVVEFYRMSGEVDYLLRVVVPDIAGYDSVYKRLIREVELSDVSSSFAMEQMKYTTALPLDYAS
jgi:Lrp/AsnC family transcriptional regulator